MRLIRLEKANFRPIKETIEEFLNPDYVYIPLNNNKLKYKQNDYVYKDDYLFINNYWITSPISGNIIGLKTMQVAKKNCKCLVIKNDFREKRAINKRRNITKIDYNYLIDSLKYNKELLNKFKSLKTVSNMYINIIEDEPYSKTNIMLFKENIMDILNVIEQLRILYHCEKCNIYLKDIDSSIIIDCLNTIGMYPFINLSLVDDLYLLGNELCFKKHFKIKEEDSLYLNIDEVITLIYLLKNIGQKDNSLLTLGGNNLLSTGSIKKIKVGTSLKELLKSSSYKENSVFYINGLMQGFATTNLDFVITEDIKCIFIMPKVPVKSQRCLNCGKCLNICPVGINPQKMYLENKKSSRCLNCGLCNYICPSYINLKDKVR